MSSRVPGIATVRSTIEVARPFFFELNIALSTVGDASLFRAVEKFCFERFLKENKKLPL